MENEYIELLSLDKSLANLRAVRELDAAIKDVLTYNYFSVVEKPEGPYKVSVAKEDSKLVLEIKTSAKKAKPIKISLSIRSFRSVVKDYFIVFESYQDMLRGGQVEKIEAVDMGRRGLHNEGAELLLSLLENKVNMDFETARRFFTIITVLHMK